MDRFFVFLFMRISILSFCLLMAVPALASEHVIGGLRNVQPEAAVLRNGNVLPAINGMDIFASDELRTGHSGALGIIFKDNTRISLGPDSLMAIHKYIFQPKRSKMGMLVEVFHGTAAYLSGIMAKISPESVSLQTPLAVIGARGTAFLIDAGNN